MSQLQQQQQQQQQQSQYILNLEKAALPVGWPKSARQLSVREGLYQSDFDIVVFPKELTLYLEQYREEKNLPIQTSRIPAGIDFSTLPAGAFIQKVN